MWARRWWAGLGAVVLAGACSHLSAAASLPGGSEPIKGAALTIPRASAPSTGSGVSKVLFIVEENRSEADVVAPGAMPYLMGLANHSGGRLLTNYRAVTHPSNANYIALTSGLIRSAKACAPAVCPVSGPSVFGQALSTGHTASAYEQSMPSACYTRDRSPYNVGHNPWAYYVDERSSCSSFDEPITTRVPNPSRLPTVSMVTPDLLHDAHDGTIQAADTYLSGLLPPILASTDFQSGALAIVVTFDESSDGCGCANNVAMVVLQKSLAGGSFATPSPLTHIDTYHSLLAVATGAGTGPLLGAFGL